MGDDVQEDKEQDYHCLQEEEGDDQGSGSDALEVLLDIVHKEGKDALEEPLKDVGHDDELKDAQDTDLEMLFHIHWNVYPWHSSLQVDENDGGLLA